MKKTVTELKPLNFAYGVMLGCDPEFFFTTNGKVVGSEKILPEKGFEYETAYGYYDKIPSKFIIDGVQAELNPSPNCCRAYLGNEIHQCFKKLYEQLKADGKNVGVDFAPLVDISKKELDSLSEKSKQFGCAPSTNIYQTKKAAKIKVNPKKYLKRSAGGHIHLGCNKDENDSYIYDNDGNRSIRLRNLRAVLRDADTLVPMLDLVLANTCVLIDRDPGNAERRQNYGRVGEFRLKTYGLEYRTLSNFWLRSYQLMSFVMGVARMTVHLVQQSTKDNDYVKALMDAVPREDVIKAVQENDFDLAYQNFKKIEHILVAAGHDNNYDYPFSNHTIKAFHHFVVRGIDYWFKEDALQHWVKLPEGHNRGWESFCKNRVKKDMNKRKSKPAVKVVEDEPIRRQATRRLAVVAVE